MCPTLLDMGLINHWNDCAIPFLAGSPLHPHGPQLLVRRATPEQWGLAIRIGDSRQLNRMIEITPEWLRLVLEGREMIESETKSLSTLRMKRKGLRVQVELIGVIEGDIDAEALEQAVADSSLIDPSRDTALVGLVASTVVKRFGESGHGFARSEPPVA